MELLSQWERGMWEGDGRGRGGGRVGDMFSILRRNRLSAERLRIPFAEFPAKSRGDFLRQK